MCVPLFVCLVLLTQPRPSQQYFQVDGLRPPHSHCNSDTCKEEQDIAYMPFVATSFNYHLVLCLQSTSPRIAKPLCTRSLLHVSFSLFPEVISVLCRIPTHYQRYQFIFAVVLYHLQAPHYELSLKVRNTIVLCFHEMAQLCVRAASCQHVL